MANELSKIMVNHIITAGTVLATKIKQAFYADKEWTPKLAQAVGLKMAAFKEIARPYHAELDEVQFLHLLGSYSIQDIQDAFEEEPTREVKICGQANQPKRIGELMAASTGVSL